MGIEQKLTHKIVIEQFDGPFHVLVELLNSRDLGITEVNLSEITEQYISTINKPDEDGKSVIDPYLLADFLVVASKLVYLKSKELLPAMDIDDDEDDDNIDLEKQLKMYKRYYEASQVIGDMASKCRAMYSRDKIAVDVDVIFNPPHTITADGMRDVFCDVVKRLEPVVKIPEKVMRRVVSLREKMDHVRQRILSEFNTNFRSLINDASDKSELVVTFLAVLELVKQKVLIVDQDELHGDISIQKSDMI